MINTNVISKIIVGLGKEETSNKLKELRNVVELCNYKILPNKVNGKVLIDKIFYSNYSIFSLSALIFNTSDLFTVERYTSQIQISNIELSRVDYKKLLLADIYMYVIKNKILVI